MYTMSNGKSASGIRIRSNSVRHTNALVGVKIFSSDDITNVAKVTKETFNMAYVFFYIENQIIIRN